METFLSMILNDLASRSISLLINKCSKPTLPSVEERLQQLLLRVRIIVEEAEGRLITNQAMLQQLNMLRKEMYRGYYTLGNFICHGHEEDNAKDHEVSNYFKPSKLNPAKRIRFLWDGGQSLQDQLQQVLGSLQVILEDMHEFVMFLNSCPRLCCQPYSMHLLIDKCLFGRQMEMEHIMNFLLKEDTPGAENPGVLPIIGPGKVGKTTLIAHACDDERVRNHFSQIVCFSQDDLEDANMESLRDSGAIKHQNHTTGGERILIIIELTREIDEGAWRRLYSASKSCVANGRKIIVSSRSDKIACFGTTQALRLRFFTQEAYWYFFKVRAFGSIDTEEHPKMASIAMEIATELNRCFMSSGIFNELLKANFNTRFWSTVLTRIREFRKFNISIYANFDGPWEVVESAYVRRVNEISSENIVILHDYQTYSVPNMLHRCTNSAQSEAEVPLFSLEDLLFGSVRPQGKFKVLGWRSHLPPYYDYMFSCEVRTFGSLDAEEHPKLASLAMDLAREMSGCFMGSCIYSVLLKANFSARFWSMDLARIREFKLKNNLIYNAYLVGGPWEAVKPAYVRTVNKISPEYLVVLHDYQTFSIPNMSESEVSEVSMQDFLFGSVKPQRKFKVLAWRPHYNYIFNCECGESSAAAASTLDDGGGLDARRRRLDTQQQRWARCVAAAAGSMGDDGGGLDARRRQPRCATAAAISDLEERMRRFLT
uniref:NB-ARC domain-containing protein n=1 Tax=Oryza rufipogon TaxID=4529 RepID=A0A0E0Q3E6_ORYRU